MNYNLLQEFSGALPAALQERYKTADGAALKVALLFLEQKSAGIDDICAALNIERGSAERALAFWESTGLISKGERPAAQKRVYTLEMLARSSLTNPEIPELLRESQRILGRPTSHAENLQLAGLYEGDGLPVEFILFVLEYSRGFAKPGGEVRYAERVAQSWQKAGIATLQQAEQHLIKLQRQEEQAQQVAAALGRDASAFTKRERRMISDWYEKFDYDADFAAEAALQSGKTDIAYINSMLVSWHEKKYRTLRQTRNTTINVKSSGRESGAKGTLFDEVANRYQGEPK